MSAIGSMRLAPWHSASNVLVPTESETEYPSFGPGAFRQLRHIWSILVASTASVVLGPTNPSSSMRLSPLHPRLSECHSDLGCLSSPVTTASAVLPPTHPKVRIQIKDMGFDPIRPREARLVRIQIREASFDRASPPRSLSLPKCPTSITGCAT